MGNTLAICRTPLKCSHQMSFGGCSRQRQSLAVGLSNLGDEVEEIGRVVAVAFAMLLLLLCARYLLIGGSSGRGDRVASAMPTCGTRGKRTASRQTRSSCGKEGEARDEEKRVKVEPSLEERELSSTLGAHATRCRPPTVLQSSPLPSDASRREHPRASSSSYPILTH